MKISQLFFGLLFFSSTLLLQGCNHSSSSPSSGDTVQTLPDTSKTDPTNVVPSAPTTALTTPASMNVLLFNGTGISTSDWESFQSILQGMNLTVKVVNSAELEAMTINDLKTYGLIIVPGGHGGTMSDNLDQATKIRVRQAVRDYGVSYLGICAGAWVAVGSEASGDGNSSYGFPVIAGTHLANWWPNGNTSTVAAVVPVTFADGTSRQLVWWGGPSTPDWTGGVVARYSNGKAAISEAWSGNGFVVLSGPHPEAPQGWRATAGTDSDGLDYDIAKELITAALNRKPLPTY